MLTTAGLLHTPTGLRAAESEAAPAGPVFGPYRREPADAVPVAAWSALPAGHPNDGVHAHDGFYLRLAGGAGFGLDALEASGVELSLPQAKGARGHLRGLAVATELAIGWSPWRSVVLGASCDTALLPGPTAPAAEGASSYEFATSELVVLGPFIDWYPFDQVGLHAQASMGLGVLVLGTGWSPSRDEPVGAHSAVGAALTVGLGHEWWIAEQWGLGVLCRGMYGRASGRDQSQARYEHEFGSLSILVTATYQ